MNMSSHNYHTLAHGGVAIAMSGKSHNGENVGELDIAGFARILKMKWKTIAAITGAALLAARAYSEMATPRFEATTRILVNPQQRNALGNYQAPQDGGTNRILIESQTRIIASDAVLKRVVKREKLYLDPEFAGGSSPSLLALLGFGGERKGANSRQKAASEALVNLRRKLSVKRPAQTYVIDLTVSSRDGEKAARLSRAIARAYLEDQSANRASASRDLANQLRDRLAELRRKLRADEARVQNFKARHNMVEAGGALVNERRLKNLSDELQAARTRMAEAGARLANIRQMLASGVMPESFDEALKSRAMAVLRDQYAIAAKTEAQLAATLGPRHPRLIAARARLARAKGLVNAELRRLARSLKATYNIEREKVASLRKRLARAKGGLAMNNEAKIELAALEREVMASRKIYEQVLARADLSSANEKIQLINARIISLASAPSWASWPKKKLILPIALLLGLGLGIGAALILDMREDHFISSKEIAAMTGMPLLGVLSWPDMAAATSNSSTGVRLAPGRGDNRQGGQSPYFRIYQEIASIGSPFASSLLRLARNMFARFGHRSSGMVLLTSAGDGDCASQTAWGVAIAAAMNGHNILLVDADGHIGELARMLAPKGKENLRAAMAGRKTLADLIVRDNELGLSFLPLSLDGKDARQISWREYNRLMASMPAIARRYEMVLVNGGAAASSVLAQMLAPEADHIALVVEQEKARRPETLNAAEILKGQKGEGASLIIIRNGKGNCS
jgi:uncharacterized protein involved in exopolysaccharide biosynthesis/Mrp family chromosome partitioning ATPase